MSSSLTFSFNTSYITINLSIETQQWGLPGFNTSYITINQRLKNLQTGDEQSFNTSYITINREGGKTMKALSKFQYILYYY